MSKKRKQDEKEKWWKAKRAKKKAKRASLAENEEERGGGGKGEESVGEDGTAATGAEKTTAADVDVSSGAEMRKKNKKERKKRKKKGGLAAGKQESSSTEAGPPSPDTAALSPSVQYPFQVDQDDHCETSEVAYEHIAPLLESLAAKLGKSPNDLAIYDPYFCQGCVVSRLGVLGFSNVYNKCEDFYKVCEAGKTPPFDVVVTNPPYSAEHVSKIILFCVQSGKPWLLLLPNFVYLKDYYGPSLRGEEAPVTEGQRTSRAEGSGASSSGGVSKPMSKPVYLIPPKRYYYYSPVGSRTNVKSADRKTSPFISFWYLDLGAWQESLIAAFQTATAKLPEKERCYVAHNATLIPYKMMDSNDPLRKKHRDRERSKKRRSKKGHAGSGVG